STDEPFLEVMAMADLLISFSSTAIEEALQNDIPVLLYGCGGRYLHVHTDNVLPSAHCKPAAVYAVRKAGDLAPALRQIQEMLDRGLDRSHFELYRFAPNQCVPIGSLWADSPKS
ncbi:MAG: hypothetical protein AAB091_05140, partial [Elusimicrobiota bacterium]